MVIRKIEGDCHTRKAAWFTMTGKSTPRYRNTERYRAAQGRNDYTYLAHDLAARPAGKFQFHDPLPCSDIHKPFFCTLFQRKFRAMALITSSRTMGLDR